MPQKYRLSRADFIKLAALKGRRVHGAFFSLTVSSIADLKNVKCACVASKKAAARAHDRNRIERRCREALRPLLKNIDTPVALVFHARAAAAKASFDEIRKEMQGLLARAA